jgi:hypothetical protein
VPSWLVGERTADDAEVFMRDLASRLANRVQLTTDGLKLYVKAVETVFAGDIDYAVLHKIYDSAAGTGNERRYSPAVCTGIEIRKVNGNPNLAKASTSFVERQNLTMRMGLRRYTRLNNAFSKKVENLTQAVSLHYMYYNFARPHATLTKDADGRKTTPAMAARVENHVWTCRDIAALLD